jgi:hypothetical protein
MTDAAAISEKSGGLDDLRHVRNPFHHLLSLLGKFLGFHKNHLSPMVDSPML